VKVVATGYVSNSLGTVNPVAELARWAHGRGAIMVVDGAQAAPHRAIDVQALGCDFFAASGHKLCGPSGIGFLWGKAELLEAMEPFLLGGHMIRQVTVGKTTWGELPHKFEAGTPNVADAVGLAAACEYLEQLGMDAVRMHEHQLMDWASERLAALDGVTVYGPLAAERSGVVSFTVRDVHPHDLATILDQRGVCVRAGHHCCQPLMRRLGVHATARASFWVYSTPDDVDALVAGVEAAQAIFAAV
jgi:cysteine desulfurase/selenocysteine lyase